MTKYDNGGEFWFNSTRPPNSLTASTVYPARYTNRSVLGSREYSLDGDYYLRLSIPLTDKPSSEGYLLTVVVSGDVEAGPVYQVGQVAATTSASTGAESLSASSSRQHGGQRHVRPADNRRRQCRRGRRRRGPIQQHELDVSRLGLVVLLAAVTVVVVLRRGRSVKVPPDAP